MLQALSPTTTFTPHLVVNDVDSIMTMFGQPGDFVINGIGHEYSINEYPYKGPASLNSRHDGMYGSERYLAQNKGLVLYACGSPLPNTVEGANDTEKAIILAIAMQASALAALHPGAGIDSRQCFFAFIHDMNQAQNALQ